MTLENDIRMERLDRTKEVASHVNGELDWANLKRFQKDNEKIMASDSNDKIVFIGDSITEGWSISDPDFF